MPLLKSLLKFASEGSDHAKWYDDAQAQVVECAAQLGVTPRRFADILALTSPRVTVTRNVRAAIHYIRTGKPIEGTIKGTRAALVHYELTGEIRGPKTSAFAKALLGDSQAVVLDVWMSVAFSVPQRDFDHPIRHAYWCSVVRTVGELAGLTPIQAQAAIWGGCYRANNPTGSVPVFDIVGELANA